MNALDKMFFSFLICCLITVNAFGQEKTDNNTSMFLLPFGYDFIHFQNQIIQNPALGAGFLLGEQDIPFTEVERRFLALALYRPFIFSETPHYAIPNYFHRIEALFDGRIERHQILFIFRSASDKPISGGLNTFQAGVGWGYEIIRRPNVSLILGAALGVSDFGLTLPSGASWPLLPLPLIRFDVATHWFSSSFDFLTGPNFKFTVAPNSGIRFTADMRMDHYRSIADLICEFTLWYRFFPPEHRLGDFAGIGVGFKNDSSGFNLSRDILEETFEIRKASIFAVLDLSLLRMQGGWIFDSAYLLDGKRAGSPGRGFFLSIQGIIPFGRR
jgi:hypothetical protein